MNTKLLYRLAVLNRCTIIIAIALLLMLCFWLPETVVVRDHEATFKQIREAGTVEGLKPIAFKLALLGGNATRISSMLFDWVAAVLLLFIALNILSLILLVKLIRSSEPKQINKL
jgi:hypothetical protein